MGPPAGLGFAQCQGFFYPSSVREGLLTKALSVQSQSCLTSPERNTQELKLSDRREGLPPSEPVSCSGIIFSGSASEEFHFLVSYPLGQDSQISCLWDRVGPLPQLAQGEGLMPGSQGDPAGTQGNPDVGFSGGEYQAGFCFLDMWILALCLTLGTAGSAVSSSGTHAPRGAIKATWFMAKGFWIPIMALPLFNCVTLAVYSSSLSLGFLFCEKTLRIK